jgi:endo-1,4-beta-xylanase
MEQLLRTIANFGRKLPLKRRLLISLAVFFTAAAAGFLIYMQQHPTAAYRASSPSLDLLANQDWSHMSGAEPISGGVEISGLDRKIVNQDGSGGQANPPVNVRGPRLSVKGDFKLTFQPLGQSDSSPACLYIYGGVPVIYDEWRYVPPQLEVSVTPTKLTVYVWTGKNDEPQTTRTWNIQAGQQPIVSVVQTKKLLTFEVNGRSIGTVADKKIFSGGELWFGADAKASSSSWVLHSLSAQAIDKGRLEIAQPPDIKVSRLNGQSLRALASANPGQPAIGAAVANYALFSDPAYAGLVASQFNQLVPENELKAQFVHPQAGVYSFTEADSMVEFAKANQMTIHGHNLVFSEANPKWMQTAPLGRRQQIMTGHIQTLMQHFRNNILEWDVVDEPLKDNTSSGVDNLRHNIWWQAMGDGYIDEAFNAARAANPDAKLYLNEYGLEEDGPRWDSFLALVSRLKASGVPVDGIGFQAHVHEPGDEVNGTVLKNHMETLARMGLLSRISEADVYGGNQNRQADQYSILLKACLAEPSCTSFTTWGLSDKYGSTTELHQYPLQYGNDLVWDEHLQPKQAYNSLLSTL